MELTTAGLSIVAPFPPCAGLWSFTLVSNLLTLSLLVGKLNFI